eukprot:4036367-Amphidinium_carterae.1
MSRLHAAALAGLAATRRDTWCSRRQGNAGPQPAGGRGVPKEQSAAGYGVAPCAPAARTRQPQSGHTRHVCSRLISSKLQRPWTCKPSICMHGCTLRLQGLEPQLRQANVSDPTRPLAQTIDSFRFTSHVEKRCLCQEHLAPLQLKLPKTLCVKSLASAFPTIVAHMLERVSFKPTFTKLDNEQWHVGLQRTLRGEGHQRGIRVIAYVDSHMLAALANFIGYEDGTSFIGPTAPTLKTALASIARWRRVSCSVAVLIHLMRTVLPLALSTGRTCCVPSGDSARVHAERDHPYLEQSGSLRFWLGLAKCTLEDEVRYSSGWSSPCGLIPRLVKLWT